MSRTKRSIRRGRSYFCGCPECLPLWSAQYVPRDIPCANGAYFSDIKGKAYAKRTVAKKNRRASKAIAKSSY